MDAMVMNWRPWAKPRPSTEARRALADTRAALERSQEHLAEARRHRAKVSEITEALTSRIERDPFAEFYERSVRREGDA